ncbi:MAG: sigma-70 family RNA polymerase sigma factor [Verrucomicrobia bacterium]|nr:sigma-70 family RNA polymerase sigma factor [Verrucomicrobiota bacterium]
MNGTPMPPANDDHERFMRLFLEHEPAILRSVLVFVPHRADARDIVQETAVALWRHFAEYDPARPFVNWACGFARIEVRRFLRRRQRRAALSETAAAALIESEEAQSAWHEERERHLADCRARLAPEQRRILDGYYVDELDVNALAQRHDRSPEAIYKMLQRIRHALLDCMERKTAEARL